MRSREVWQLRFALTPTDPGGVTDLNYAYLRLALTITTAPLKVRRLPRHAGLALNHPSPLRCDAGKYMIRDKVVMVGLVGFL
jgi:hypothetical protein